MDERLIKSLIKSLGINTDELVENAKKFVAEISERHKVIETKMLEIEASQKRILELLENKVNENGK